MIRTLRKTSGLVLVFGIIATLFNPVLKAQDMVVNSGKPSGKFTGRIVKLKKLAVAHDDKGHFIFKRPHSFLSLEDGNFFLIDNESVLKFAVDGRYVKTIVNKGEGPGEATYLSQIYKRDNEIIVNTGFMGKLMVFDFDGELKAEYKEVRKKKSKMNTMGFSEITYEILAHRQDYSFIALSRSFLYDKGEKVRKDSVALLSDKNEWKKSLFEIPIDSIIIKAGREKFALEKLSVIHVCDDKFLYFSNTERYEVKKYNIEENKIEAVWKRKYKPVSIPEDLKDKIQYGAKFMSGSKNGKTNVFKVPTPEYFHDIKQLFVVNSHLWVMTSTYDKEKGILIDVYDRKGQYIDNFFITFPDIPHIFTLFQSELHIFKGNIYIKEIDEEGNYMAVKYEIIDDRNNSL